MVRKVVSRYKPIILFIQETKLRKFDNGVVRSLGGNLLTRGIGVEAEGVSGGLISLWNDESFTVKACINSKRCIIMVGELIGVKQEMGSCNIYAANVERERKELWDYVIDAQKIFPLPWVIGGDFNSVLDPKRGKGEGEIWEYRDEASWARLDRFLISPKILLWFPNLLQFGLPRSLSNHNAILIGEKAVDWGPKPFHLFNGWLEDKEMMKEAVKGWKGCKVESSKS
ncbi:hypothetical protein Dsin_008716 [Dipteronia sinensis]|uniref:Endonuclease/exonuclease/phosphatase domain-containing protein n=1 Tax=Dipteronia sinensis TaxID=43782 RepID=A0AAE0EB23_9ROSI|nr:hypothetical protein Dsin_008716 [Dipteronia sinensis]